MVEGVRRRGSFPDAFKWQVIAAMRGGRSASQVGAELGLPDRMIRFWLRWAEGRAPARRVGPSPADQAAEIAHLRKDLERVRMERDILKRAALIFGQATDRR